MKILATILTLAATLIFTGCILDEDGALVFRGGQDHFRIEASTEPVEEAGGEAAKKGYAKSLARWKSTRIADAGYSYQVDMNCFCYPMGWMNLKVEEGVVSEIDTVPGQPPLFDEAQIATAPTVDQLFNIILRHMGNPDFSLSVKYDKKLGYPTRIDIVNRTYLRDSDFHIKVTELQRR